MDIFNCIIQIRIPNTHCYLAIKGDHYLVIEYINFIDRYNGWINFNVKIKNRHNDYLIMDGKNIFNLSIYNRDNSRILIENDHHQLCYDYHKEKITFRPKKYQCLNNFELIIAHST